MLGVPEQSEEQILHLGPDTAVAASKAVIHVPILAPRVNGYTSRTFSTPVPTSGTIKLVVVDED